MLGHPGGTGGHGHPHDDQLADLVADALPPDEARLVEHHVLGCERCTGLLAEAEAVRAWLRRDDAGPMPADVLAGIEAALGAPAGRATPGPAAHGPATGATGRAAGPWTGPTTGPTTGPVAGHDLGGRPAPPTDSTRVVRRVPGADTGATRRIPRTPAASGQTGRLQRVVHTPERARRQALEEQRSEGTEGWASGRRGRLLGAAAAAAVVLGVGGVIAGGLLGDDGTAGQVASSGDTGGGIERRAATNVLGTGTDYRRETLAQGANRLIGTAAGAALAPEEGRAAADGSSPVAAASGRFSGNLSLRSPEALRACLDELGVDAEPYAVDLATYQGREAAVIVVPAAAGAQDVWVVARDCRPGADGTMEYTTITP